MNPKYVVPAVIEFAYSCSKFLFPCGAQISERQGSAQLSGQSVSGEYALDPIDQREVDESETLRQMRGGDQTDRHRLDTAVDYVQNLSVRVDRHQPFCVFDVGRNAP